MSEREDKPELRRIQIDLAEIAIAMQSNSYEMTWFLDTETGQVHMFGDGMFDGEDVDEDFDIDEHLESDRYRTIRGVGSCAGYRMMEAFVESLPQGEIRISCRRRSRSTSHSAASKMHSTTSVRSETSGSSLKKLNTSGWLESGSRTKVLSRQSRL
jgi:hypothetical protein